MNENLKSGQIFIAYKGYEFNKDEIVAALCKICPSNHKVNYTYFNDCGVVFAKNVYDEGYYYTKEPYWNYQDEILTVNGYRQNEINEVNKKFGDYSIGIFSEGHKIINYMFRDYSIAMFEKLGSDMHFCSVIWDKKNDSIIAGVTEPNSRYTHLYYGYTDENHEIMFSNNESILKIFCDNIREMESNTYMKDGEIFTLGDDKVRESNDFDMIKKTKQNSDAVIDVLNALLFQITNQSIKSIIEKNIEEYLSSDDPKKKIEDYLLNEFDLEMKKTIAHLIEKAIQDYNIEGNIQSSLTTLFDNKLAEYYEKINLPVVNVIKLKETVLGQTKGGFYHEKFEQILTQVQLDEPIMLIGPAGSGKNVSVSQVAEALGLRMYYTNNASNEFKLTGFIDAGGNYRDTEFYKAFKNGGVFFLDEIDNSDPSALIVINSALANGYMSFPHETIDRHPMFRIIAAANTWGKGADLQYVGRNALDGATLDRFDNIFFDYDQKLEEALYPSHEVLEFMWSFRNAVLKLKIPHIVSTRGIGKVYKKHINGISVQDTLTSNVIKNLGQDDVNTIIGNMKDIDLDNKYFVGIKKLRLKR